MTDAAHRVDANPRILIYFATWARKRTVKALVSAAPARRVVVALRMAGIAGQDKLNGIFSYLNEGHRWSLAIHRTQHEFTAEAVRAEIARGVDGFLVGLPGTDDALAEIAKTDRPAVLLNVPSRARTPSRISSSADSAHPCATTATKTAPHNSCIHRLVLSC